MLTFVFFTHLLLGVEHIRQSVAWFHFACHLRWNGYVGHINPSASISRVLTPNNTLPLAVKPTRYSYSGPDRDRSKART
ncbi:hypothetical protein ACLKA7_001696 [Drosophila subpalustris]